MKRTLARRLVLAARSLLRTSGSMTLAAEQLAEREGIDRAWATGIIGRVAYTDRLLACARQRAATGEFDSLSELQLAAQLVREGVTKSDADSVANVLFADDGQPARSATSTNRGCGRTTGEQE